MLFRSSRLSFQSFVDVVVVSLSDQRDVEKFSVEAVDDSIFADIGASILKTGQGLRIGRLGVHHQVEGFGGDLPELFGRQGLQKSERVMGEVELSHACVP